MVALIAGKLYSFFSLLYRLRSAVMRRPAHVSRPIAGPHEEQRSQQGTKLSHHAQPNRRDSSHHWTTITTRSEPGHNRLANSLTTLQERVRPTANQRLICTSPRSRHRSEALCSFATAPWRCGRTLPLRKPRGAQDIHWPRSTASGPLARPTQRLSAFDREAQELLRQAPAQELRASSITTAEKLLAEVRTLPEAQAKEMLDFVAFLKSRLQRSKSSQQDVSAFDRFGAVYEWHFNRDELYDL